MKTTPYQKCASINIAMNFIENEISDLSIHPDISCGEACEIWDMAALYFKCQNKNIKDGNEYICIYAFEAFNEEIKLLEWVRIDAKKQRSIQDYVVLLLAANRYFLSVQQLYLLHNEI